MFRFSHLSLAAVGVLLASFICCATQPAVPAEPPSGPPQWVRELASDSYAVRQSAASKLLVAALANSETESHIRRLLCQEISVGNTGDLESQVACRRLQHQLTQRDQENKLDLLLHDRRFDGSELEGWPLFCKHAGNGNDARLVYRQIARQRLAFVLESEPGSDAGISRWEDQRDIEQIAPDDIARWAIRLTIVCESIEQNRSTDTLRLDLVLRSIDRGPMPTRDFEQRVIAALVSRYLATATVDARDRLTIAKRFRCSDQVRADCRAILENPLSPPSHVTVALLVASAADFSPKEIDSWINNRLTDHRISHVWQSPMPTRATYRTQVSDVAFALRLHRLDIDPRSTGYRGLLAHPILVFQPYSLGFQSEADRRASRRSAIMVEE